MQIAYLNSYILFTMIQEWPIRWIHILSPILEKSLATYKAASKIQSGDFNDDTTYLIDGIERTVQRDTYHQEDFYSGKKKTHTVKNLVITNLLGFIIWASPTAYGLSLIHI